MTLELRAVLRADGCLRPAGVAPSACFQHIKESLTWTGARFKGPEQGTWSEMGGAIHNKRDEEVHKRRQQSLVL